MRNIHKAIVLASALAMAPLARATPAADGPGKPIYDKTCASCHGVDGRGNPTKARVFKIDPDLLNLGRDAVASQTREEKRAITAEGKGKMPAYGKKLGAAELDAVIDHVMALIAAIREGH